ncbi:MAG: tetratricopeptide repeat protein [Bdellovibrionota bacterium]
MNRELNKETATMLQSYLGNKYILVCDPSSNFRTSIKQFLLNLRVKNVKCVSNIAETKRELLSTKVGLFIVEWINEGQSGLQFCRDIKKSKEHRATPFLLISSENLRQDVVLASEGGVSRYLLKPFSYEDFTKKMHSIMKEEQDPNPTRILLKQAENAIFAEDYDEAEELFKMAQKTDKDSAKAIEGLAKICVIRKQFTKAITLLEIALSMNSKYIGAHRLLLEIFEETNDNEGKLKETQILHKLSPDNPAYCLKLATIYLKQGQLTESEEYFKKSIMISPMLAQAYKGLGDIAMIQKEFPEARKAYQKSLDLEPDDISTLNSLGMTFVRMGKYHEGIQRYAMALKIDANNIKILFNLGHAWEKLGNYKEAFEKYSQALEISPTFDKAKRGISRLNTLKQL